MTNSTKFNRIFFRHEVVLKKCFQILNFLKIIIIIKLTGISLTCDNTTGELTMRITSVDYETKKEHNFNLTIGDNAPLPFRRYSRYGGFLSFYFSEVS